MRGKTCSLRLKTTLCACQNWPPIPNAPAPGLSNTLPFRHAAFSCCVPRTARALAGHGWRAPAELVPCLHDPWRLHDTTTRPLRPVPAAPLPSPPRFDCPPGPDKPPHHCHRHNRQHAPPLHSSQHGQPLLSPPITPTTTVVVRGWAAPCGQDCCCSAAWSPRPGRPGERT